MKKKSSPRRDSETLEASSRAILSDDAKQKVADLVTKDDVTEPLFSVPTLEQIGKLAARGRYVDDSGSLAGCCSGRKLGNERANFVRHANMAGVALCGCKLQGSLPEGRLVSVRVRLQELLEDVRFHGASRVPDDGARNVKKRASQPCLCGSFGSAYCSEVQMSKGKAGGGRGSHGKDVYVQPHPDGWQVKKAGNERASAVTATKKAAEQIGRDAARKEHSELVIKGEDGRIQQKDSHGHDPRRSKG